MKCRKCGQDFPSRYYFKTPGVCSDCAKKDAAQPPTQPPQASARDRKSETVLVQGRTLYCPVCGEEKFDRRNPDSSKGTTVPTWTTYVCSSCGLVLSFEREAGIDA